LEKKIGKKNLKNKKSKSLLPEEEEEEEEACNPKLKIGEAIC
jgi:hypothetical protein